MSLFRRLTVLAGAVEAARRYARSHPDQAGKALDSAAQFVDKQTKGKYTNQIAGAARKAKDAAGIPQPGYGFGSPGTTPPAPPPRGRREPAVPGRRCRRSDAAHPAAAPGVPAAEPGAAARRLTSLHDGPGRAPGPSYVDVRRSVVQASTCGAPVLLGAVTCQDRR